MSPNEIFAPADPAQDMVQAAHGDVSAAMRLGYGYLTGYTGVVDFNQARSWFRSTAPASTAGAVWLAYTDLVDPATRNNLTVTTAALQSLTSAANAGDPVGQTLLGRVYERGGAGRPPDPGTARAWYLAAASQFALAQTYLAEMSVRAQQYEDAVPPLQAVYATGELRGTVDLADLYARKRSGVTQFALAKFLLRSAAQRGNIRALFRLGLLYLDGVGGNPPNPRRAFNVFTRCAYIGYPPAQTELGLAYANGIGVTTDLQKARLWLGKASRYVPRAAEALRGLPDN